MTSQAMTSEGVGFFRESDTSPGEYVEIAEVKSWSGPGGASSEYEVTHLKSTAKEIRLGLPDEGPITLELNYLPKSESHKAMLEDRRLRRIKNFRIVYTDSSPATVQDFVGYVQQYSTTGGVNQAITATIVIRVTSSVAVE